MKKTKVYIAGRISGITLEEAKELFKEAEQRLRANKKIEPINPLKYIKQGLTAERIEQDPQAYEQQMQECFRLIDQCQAVYMLHNWKDSKGATREREYAIKQGKSIIDIEQDVKGKEIPPPFLRHITIIQLLCSMLETELLHIEDAHKRVFGQPFRHEMKQRLNRAKDSTKQVVKQLTDNIGDIQGETYYCQQSDYLLATLTNIIAILDKPDGSARQSQDKIKAYLSRYKTKETDTEIINKLYDNADY